MRELGSKGDSRAIVQTVLSMAQDLMIGVVAEGVEPAFQEGLIREHSPSLDVQVLGNLYSQPRPAEEFERLFFPS